MGVSGGFGIAGPSRCPCSAGPSWVARALPRVSQAVRIAGSHHDRLPQPTGRVCHTSLAGAPDRSASAVHRCADGQAGGRPSSFRPLGARRRERACPPNGPTRRKVRGTPARSTLNSTAARLLHRRFTRAASGSAGAAPAPTTRFYLGRSAPPGHGGAGVHGRSARATAKRSRSPRRATAVSAGIRRPPFRPRSDS
jgi:hypothetical protein